MPMRRSSRSTACRKSAGRVPRAGDESTTGMNFNDMTIDNIEAIEVYKAPAAWMSYKSQVRYNPVTNLHPAHPAHLAHPVEKSAST
jgi:hypothetical protein